MRFLRRKVSTIFIMLGNGCNMSCKYCLQHPLVHHQLTGSIDPAIYDFIREVKEENGDAPLRLHFFGGEPTLYFANIKEIVENLKDLDLEYSIITNGRAVTDEMVEFFNSHNIPVAVSWDGPHVLETRGFDSFSLKNPALRRRLLRIDNLGITAVLSAKAYPIEVLEGIQALTEEYYKLHGQHLWVNCDEIFDTGLPDKELFNVDYARVQREITEMTVNYINSAVSGEWCKEDYAKNMWIGMMHRTLKDYCRTNGEYKRELAFCGNGFRVLNMDLSGNLYPCHNTSEKIGHITDDFWQYFERVLAGDNIRARREVCRQCIAMPYCQGGCKLISDELREKSYCKMKRAVFGPIISLFAQYGAKLGEAENGG